MFVSRQGKTDAAGWTGRASKVLEDDEDEAADGDDEDGEYKEAIE